MAQEPSSKDLLEAVKQQESGGRRYKADGKTLLEGPQTKYGTAKGEMQVLDMTNRDPGFGVRPAKDDSAEERARVGEDYLAAMVKRYGNKETALVAYNWGPGNTDNWLKSGADPAKLPKETQNYVAKITGSLGSTKVAQAPVKAAPVKAGIQKTAFNPAQNPIFAQLGPSYQAAFAVSMLADEGEKEGKSEDEPSESEKMLMEATARPVALASVDLGYQSPFPQQPAQQPIKMAAGGVPYVPTAGVRPSARAQLNDIKSQWDTYNTKTTDYNTKVAEYNRQLIEYQKLVDAYNAGPRTSDFTAKEPTLDFTAPTQPAVSAEQYQAIADAAKKDAAHRNMALSVAANPEQYGLSMNKFFADGGEVDYFQDPLGAPSAPITADTLTPGKPFKAADALQAAKEVGKGMVRSGKAIAQGVSETPYNLAGMPADVGNLVLTPFGLGSKEPALGSEHLKRLALQAGIRQAPPTDPRDAGFYTMGELGAGFVNPGPIAAKVGQAAEKAATVGGTAVAREMLRGMEGQGVLAPVSPQESIMYAVKPRGGTFLTSGSMDKPPISKLDETLNRYLDSTLDKIPNSDEAAPIIKEFLDKKARRYFTAEFGTGADPLRRAISSGELQPINRDVERFPEYLLHAARTKGSPGHEQAVKDLERIYDSASTLEARIVGLHDPADADARSQFNRLLEASKAKTREAMALEGMPQELQNIQIHPIAGERELGLSYNAPYAAAINDFQNFPAQAGAIQKAEPIYDLGYSGTYMEMFSPRVVAENLSVLPVNKLKNMSFADAMYEGAKRMEMFRNYDKAVEKVEKGAAVPKEILLQFTKPVLKTDNSNEWVKLTDKAATKMEGKMLHHSVGGYANSNSYGHGGREGFDKGLANVFSLRDPKTGYAKATIEAKKLEDGTLMFSQHKGDFNSFPEKNVEDVFKLYDKIGKDKVSFSRYEEMYPNDATGTPLARPIAFNWGKAYEHWKSTGTLPPIPTAAEKLPPPPGQINIPFAKGGMVERQPSTARYI